MQLDLTDCARIAKALKKFAVILYKNLFTWQTARCWAIPLSPKTGYDRRAVQDKTRVTLESIDNLAILSFISQYGTIANYVFQWKASLTEYREGKSNKIRFIKETLKRIQIRSREVTEHDNKVHSGFRRMWSTPWGRIKQREKRKEAERLLLPIYGTKVALNRLSLSDPNTSQMMNWGSDEMRRR